MMLLLTTLRNRAFLIPNEDTFFVAYDLNIEIQAFVICVSN